ncbi:hypothetical protein [Rhizobium leguminosarum]|uniref:hypothetical protein n=1 Tax=Rhizobium leguminosarum TaxID=384 RepID=UPI001C96B7C6|nr:hypothetical protein [Rhizobium leguminosarum]MBY5658295.1 hypothetical protein [Rhizobium leguminosarum]
MVSPDFSKQTLDILARRARFQCSNPDCGVHTTGPNSDPEKATTIGEAAHIFGAKPGSMRFDAAMSDVTRSSITNGIWLCRNCHGHIDRDEANFPAILLFAWRKEHEERMLLELGTRGERIRHEVEKASLHFLAGYPQIIQRIVADRPVGWEWRLAAELLRHLTTPQIKRFNNLVAGHYYRAYPRVKSEDFTGWLSERTHVMSKLTGPLVHLYQRLTESFGKPGEPGDAEEINDVCKLISEMIGEMINHEEVLRFTLIPDEGGELRTLLIDAIGGNLKTLVELPEALDGAVALIGTDHGGTVEEPRIVKWKATFELPEDFVSRFEEAVQRFGQAVGT